MPKAKLTFASENHLPVLMSWLPDKSAALEWGGPQLRYPFDAQSFHADSRWRELPSYTLVNDAGEMLGFGQFYLRMNRCHLGRLIISPQHRGMGFGALLISELVGLGCKELGVQECSLFVLQNNIRARTLYEKLGFTPAIYPEQHDWLAGCDYMIATDWRKIRRTIDD